MFGAELRLLQSFLKPSKPGFSGLVNSNCFPFSVQPAMSAVCRQSRTKMCRRQETKSGYFQAGGRAGAIVELIERCNK